MPELPHSLLFFTLTFLAAGLVKGITGMGLPTVAMGLLGSSMPPSAAAAMLVVPSLVTNIWQWITGPHKRVLLKRFWPMMLAALISTIFCAAWLVKMEPAGSRKVLGVLLMIYAGYALVSPELAIPGRFEKWLSPVVGFITGIATGFTGVFVMPAVPYLQSLRIERDMLVQALGLSFTVSTVALALGLMFQGAFRLDQWGLSSIAIVPSLLGMWAGQKVRSRISPKRFRQCFLLFLVVLGLELTFQPFA